MVAGTCALSLSRSAHALSVDSQIFAARASVRPANPAPLSALPLTFVRRSTVKRARQLCRRTLSMVNDCHLYRGAGRQVMGAGAKFLM